ncbi:DUF5681 domain-containing protein [Microvirga aerophila]|uniref:DUF5681 domain-containing protein n=1 Tax=Microvirga aerophila TaxID=670291 RepID=A0A512C2G3_9HYPH|nr:DUF5681 domain-containing protein [Microvirga aerophila]GEO18403.1 hypothetical protein MAE02_60990 [Microvirga aerophila]
MFGRSPKCEETRGKPFEPGYAGRPKGSRNKTTLALEALLDGEAEAITRKAVEMALEGDLTAMRLVMDRIMPPRKERPIMCTMPKMETAADAVKGSAALVDAVANGDITPGEAGELVKLIDGFTKAVELYEIQQRLDKLEATQGAK